MLIADILVEHGFAESKAGAEAFIRAKMIFIDMIPIHNVGLHLAAGTPRNIERRGSKPMSKLVCLPIVNPNKRTKEDKEQQRREGGERIKRHGTAKQRLQKRNRLRALLKNKPISES